MWKYYRDIYRKVCILCFCSGSPRKHSVHGLIPHFEDLACRLVRPCPPSGQNKLLHGFRASLSKHDDRIGQGSRTLCPDPRIIRSGASWIVAGSCSFSFLTEGRGAGVMIYGRTASYGATRFTFSEFSWFSFPFRKNDRRYSDRGWVALGHRNPLLRQPRSNVGTSHTPRLLWKENHHGAGSNPHDHGGSPRFGGVFLYGYSIAYFSRLVKSFFQFFILFSQVIWSK